MDFTFFFFLSVLPLSVMAGHTYVPEQAALQLCACVPNLLRGVTVPTLSALFLLLLNGSSGRRLFWTDLHTHLCDFDVVWISRSDGGFPSPLEVWTLAFLWEV